MNEFYACDSSRKIHAIFKSRIEKGLRCSGSVPYGYRRDPEDKQHYPENHHSHGFYDPCLWSSTAVGYILEKQEYMGHAVLGKTICENYKAKKRRKAKLEELMILEQEAAED